MNKKPLAVLVVLAGLAGLLCFACEKKGGDPVSDSSRLDKEPVSAVPEAVAGIAILGMLEQTESGDLVLASDQERYDLISDSNLSHLVGQPVKVTGIVAASGTLRVTQVAPVPTGYSSQDEGPKALDSISAENTYTKETSNDN